MNKEQLQQACTEQELELAHFKEKDNLIRQDFSKAFGWSREKHNPYGDDRELVKDATWHEIFVELGRLLANKTALMNTTFIEQNLDRIEKIEASVNNLYDQNN